MTLAEALWDRRCFSVKGACNIEDVLYDDTLDEDGSHDENTFASDLKLGQYCAQMMHSRLWDNTESPQSFTNKQLTQI